jgi:hypothetical protein
MDEAQKEKIVMVSAAYYRDNVSRNNNNFKYTPRVCRALKTLKVESKKEEIDCHIAWCATKGEAPVRMWNHENRKVYLLTNAFTYNKDGKYT